MKKKIIILVLLFISITVKANGLKNVFFENVGENEVSKTTEYIPSQENIELIDIDRILPKYGEFMLEIEADDNFYIGFIDTKKHNIVKYQMINKQKLKKHYLYVNKNTNGLEFKVYLGEILMKLYTRKSKIISLENVNGYRTDFITKWNKVSEIER